MKNLLLHTLLIFGFVQLNAQITLTRSDFTAQVGNSITRLHFDDNSAATPTEGANQTWDYTGLVITDTVTRPLTPYAGSEIPEANITWTRIEVSSSGGITAPFERTDYEILDDTEYGRVNAIFGATNISLGGFTGNPADTAYLLESSGVWPDGTEKYAWFPMNYQDTKSSSYVQDHPNLLSIGAFGLNKVPGSQIVYGTQESEVVGWGTISLINSMDGSTVSLEALLVKTIATEVDSFFTAGQPSPPNLLIPLGLTQGDTEIYSRYQFYAKGFPSPVLTIGDHYNRGLLADLTSTTSLQDIKDNFIALNYYPNPASDQLNLEFEKTTNEPWSFALYNSLGQQVLEQVVDQPKGPVQETILFGQAMQAGNYFYMLRNGEQLMSSGAVQIQ